MNTPKRMVGYVRYIVLPLIAKGSSELWMILLSILSGLVTISAYYETVSTSLTSFKYRVMGICILTGIDPNLRSEIYIKTIFLFILSFLVVFLICSILNGLWKQVNPPLHLSIEKSALSILSGVGITNFILHILTRAPAFQRTLSFLLFLIILLLVFIIGKYVLSLTITNNERTGSPDWSLLAVSFAVPYQLILSYGAFFGKHMTFGWNFFIGFGVIWCLFYIFYGLCRVLLCASSRFTPSHIDRAFVYAGISLVLIPASIPLANEIHFTLVGLIFVHPRDIALVVTLALFLISASVFTYWLMAKKSPSFGSTLVSRVYYPIIIATNMLFINYRQYITFGKFDAFHTGESTLPVQQLFQFKSIPFIDFYPPHGLFDMFPQVFYRILNGTRGLEMLLWGDGFMNGWLPTIITYLLFYALLMKLTNPLFSLVVLMCVPIEHIFLPYYSIFILPGLCIYRALKDPSFLKLSSFWFVLLFLLLWRIDFGISTAAASLLIVGGACWARSGPSLKTLFTSFLLIYVPVAFGYTVAAILKDKSIVELILQNFYYAIIQVPLSSYPKVISEYNNLAVFQYFIFPSISVLYIIFFALRVFLFRKPIDPLRHLLAFLAVTSLIISLRSLHRHSLFEGFLNPCLFVFLACFVPFYLYDLRKSRSMWVFLALSTFFYAAVPSSTSFYSFIPEHMISEKEGSPVFALNKKIFTFKTWNNKDSRVKAPDKSHHDVVRFFNHYLGKGQTFYDLSNAPLLYFFAGRKHPAYFIESAYHTSDPIQKYVVRELDAHRKEKRLPFVLFKQNTGWDHVDDVPSEIRSYRVVEFIYRNYTPLLNVNNYEIWIEKALDAQRLMEDVSCYDSMGRKYPLKLVRPKLIHDFTLDHDTEGIKLRCGTFDPFIGGFLDFGGLPQLDPAKSQFLKLTLRSSLSGLMRVYYSFNGDPFGEFDSIYIPINRDHANRFEDILIPISLPANNKAGLSDIRLDPPDGSVFEVINVEFIELNPDDCTLPSPMSITPVDGRHYKQEFSLRELPYIWGTYDDMDPVSTAEVLRDFQRYLPYRVDYDNPLNLSFDPDLDKSSGNYLHLRIKSDQEGEVFISYGNSPQSSFTFTLIPSRVLEDYLIRISSQWRWMSQPVSSFSINSTVPIDLQTTRILKGD